jgi:predicted nucleotidyltransferase component of viral defense system
MPDLAARSGAGRRLRDIMIAEKEVVLTFLLQLLSERGLIDRLAFKGGTCLRKMFIGSQGRFSTDLDVTGREENDHEDVILDMMAAFEQPFHGIQFSIPDEGYYETLDGVSWGVNPAYVREWNSGGSEIKLQISRREIPTLPTARLPQLDQSYFQHLPFAPATITCLALPEIIAEKIRACYQRNKARHLRPLDIRHASPRSGARPQTRCPQALAGWGQFRSHPPDEEIRGRQRFRLGRPRSVRAPHGDDRSPPHRRG